MGRCAAFLPSEGFLSTLPSAQHCLPYSLKAYTKGYFYLSQLRFVFPQDLRSDAQAVLIFSMRFCHSTELQTGPAAGTGASVLNNTGGLNEENTPTVI